MCWLRVDTTASVGGALVLPLLVPVRTSYSFSPESPWQAL